MPKGTPGPSRAPLRAMHRCGRGRNDAGIAVVSVMGISFVLTLVVVTLVQIGMSQYDQTARFTDGTKSQAAAEAGLNTYLAKLIQQNNFDTTFMAAGEATRVNSTSWSNPSGTPPPIDCTFDHANPPVTYAGVAVASEYATGVPDPSSDPLASLSSYNFWYHPCGFDAWTDVDADGDPTLEQYEYSVAVYPRDTISNSLRIVAAGRKRRPSGSAFDRGTLRVVELVVKPSSFSKYQMISRDRIVVTSTSTTEGEIYSESTIEHNGTVRNRVIAVQGVTGCDVGSGCSLGTWVPNTPARLPGCIPSEAFFQGGESQTSCHNLQRAGAQPEFDNIDTAIQTVASKVQSGGGMFLDAADLTDPSNGDWDGYALRFSGGNITATRCKTQPGTVAPSELSTFYGDRGDVDTPFYETNAFENSMECESSSHATASQGNPTFVYSDASLAIAGGHPDDPYTNFVTGRITVVSAKDVYVGGNIYYGTDTNETEDDYNDNVLGVMAHDELILPAWAASTQHVTGAMIAYKGTVHDSDIVAYSGYSGSCESDVTDLPLSEPYLCVKNELTWTGSFLSGSAATPSNVVMFNTNTWDFYEQLTSLAPPLWPNATNDFDIVHWLERMASFDLCADQQTQCRIAP